MRLRDYVRRELILVDLAARDVEGVVERLSAHLQEAGAVEPGPQVREALLAREAAHSTAMGHGMALPHATLPGLDTPVMMVAVAPEPIQFGPPDTEPCTVFFALLSPPGHESEHIKLLARICRLVRHPGFVTSLREAPTAEEVAEAIERIDAQHV